jgi:hypothetical protein
MRLKQHTPTIARLARSVVGNVYRDTLDDIAFRVRGRALDERPKGHGVLVYVDDEGNVGAPFDSSGSAMMVSGKFPAWEVATYRFPLPVQQGRNRATREGMPTDETTPTHAEIVSDLMFHVDQCARARAA